MNIKRKLLPIWITLLLLTTLIPLTTNTVSAVSTGQFENYKPITLNSSQVNSTLTNFPVFINLSSDADLASDALDSGWDIAFFDSTGVGATQYNHEIELFNGTTGQLVTWVNITSLAHDVDTTIYMYYNDSDIGSSAENIEGTWDSNYVYVQHFKNSTGDALDSTNYNNDIANADISVFDRTSSSLIGNCFEFDGTNDECDVGDSSSLSITNNITIEGWINLDSIDETPQAFIYKTKSYMLELADDAGDDDYVYFGLRKSADDGWHNLRFVDNAISTGSWYYLVGTYDGSTMKGYQNNNQESTTTTFSDTIFDSTYDVEHGDAEDSAFYLDGLIDECRISDISRSSDWIFTTYNTIYNGSNGGFFTLGSEETPSTAPTQSNENPANESTNQDTAFTWNTTISDPEGDSMNWSIECSNGQSNSSTGASNGSIELDLTGLSCCENYTVWVNVTDGSIWTNESYWFLTRCSSAPVISINPLYNIANNSVGVDLFIGAFYKKIEDPDGDLMNIYFEVSNGDSYSITPITNGTWPVFLSILDYDTTYTVWVNVTDIPCGNQTREWFTFTTQDAVHTNASTGITIQNATLNGWTNYSYLVNTSYGFLLREWDKATYGWNITIANYEDVAVWDLNNDRFITQAGDFTPYYNSVLGDPNYNAQVDMNSDGKINYLDTVPWANAVSDWKDLNLNNTAFSYNQGSLNSTWRYVYKAWLNGSWFEGDEVMFATLPASPSNQEYIYITDNLTWSEPNTNDPDNLTTIIRYNTNGYANLTTGTLLTETGNDYYNGGMPDSSTGYIYLTMWTNFSGNISDPVYLLIDTPGGNYTFRLRKEDANKQYAYVDLNESSVGLHEFTIHYTDGSEEHNYYEVGFWEELGDYANWTDTFLDQLENSLKSIDVEIPFLGKADVNEISWERKQSTGNSLWGLGGIYDYSYAEIEVEATADTAGSWSCLIYDRDNPATAFASETLTFNAGQTKTFTIDTEPSFSVSGDYTDPSSWGISVSTGCYWECGDVDLGVLGTYDMSPYCLDIYELNKGDEGFIVKLIGPGQGDTEVISDLSPTGSQDGSTEDQSSTWWDALGSSIWSYYVETVGIPDNCSNFTGANGWWSNITTSINENISQAESDYGLDINWEPPQLPTDLCGLFESYGGWSYLESNLIDTDTGDGVWYVNTTKEIDWVEFRWAESQWLDSDFCHRKKVVKDNQLDVTLWIRTDKSYKPIISETFNETALVQYELQFTNYNLEHPTYVKIQFIDKYGDTKVVHSEWLDGTRKVYPQLLFGHNYFIKLVEYEDGLYNEYDAGQVTVWTDQSLLLDVTSVISDLIWKYCQMTASWTATGFQLDFFETTHTTSVVNFWVYDENGSFLFTTSDSSYDKTFTYNCNTSKKYYWQIECKNAFGYFNTELIPIIPDLDLPGLSESNTNIIFTIIFGPSPFRMGNVTISYAHILIFILALFGLFAFKKNSALGLFVEGCIMMGGAALFGIDDIGSIVIGSIGFFLIILGLLAALMSQKQKTGGSNK